MTWEMLPGAIALGRPHDHFMDLRTALSSLNPEQWRTPLILMHRSA